MGTIARTSAKPGPRVGSAAVWAYVASTGIALVAGVLLDRFGPKPALAATILTPLILIGINNFKVACAGVLLLLPLVPTYLLSQSDKGISGPFVLAGALAFAALSLFFSCALRPGKIALPRLPVIFLLYLAVVVVEAINGAQYTAQTPDYMKALAVVKDTTVGAYLRVSLVIPMLIVCAAMVAAVLSANTRNVRWILLPTLGAACILSCLVILFTLQGGASLSEMASVDARRYLSGTGLHANEIGLMMNMALAITVSVSFCVRGWGKRLAMACLVLMLGATIFVTFSRGAFAGLATTLVYFILTWGGKKKMLLPLLVLAGCVIFLTPESMIKRSSYASSAQNLDDVSTGRVDEIWKPLIPDVLKSPVIGKGHGSLLWSDAAKDRTMLPVGHPHSAYLSALLDLGVVGTAVVLLFLVHVWRTLWDLRTRVRSALTSAYFYGASACVPILLVQGMTDDTFMPRYTHSFLWIAYGAALGWLSRRGFRLAALRRRSP
ncbi:hypothetical protein GCM10027321_45380 [Massilia terrae]|uniref:O-antigen ligase family protein n=1 Tax=Massilia terrae TaxID=1811224 RepID=A0ABT2D0W6_9BURK|nr:O-antigen ligase family protein [Massilia terrae]MCS0659003.1 O-antigen ligase family protein [Massilia terrae]